MWCPPSARSPKASHLKARWRKLILLTSQNSGKRYIFATCAPSFLSPDHSRRLWRPQQSQFLPLSAVALAFCLPSPMTLKPIPLASLGFIHSFTSSGSWGTPSHLTRTPSSQPWERGAFQTYYPNGHSSALCLLCIPPPCYGPHVEQPTHQGSRALALGLKFTSEPLPRMNGRPTMRR